MLIVFPQIAIQTAASGNLSKSSPFNLYFYLSLILHLMKKKYLTLCLENLFTAISKCQYQNYKLHFFPTNNLHQLQHMIYMTENCQMTLKHYQKSVRTKWENTTNYTQLCLFKATEDQINTMSVVLPKVLLHLFLTCKTN